MPEQLRRDEPASSRTLCFCPSRRGEWFALVAAVLLTAAGITGYWTCSACAIRSGPGDAKRSSPRERKLEETGEATKLSWAALPQCFSSPEADPSEGEWRSCPNGVDESPIKQNDWVLPPAHFGFLYRCDNVWTSGRPPGDEAPRPYWAWEPAKCSLAAVNEANFCRAVKGRKGILLVGDSLTRLSTTTLASVLRAKPLENDMWKDVWEACGGDLKVTFIRSDCLDARAAPDFASNQCEEFPGGPVMSQFFCQLFGTDEILREFDTLVVNSGAHPRPADQFGREMDAAADALTSSMNRLHGKDKAILVVRNTVPGHWGCTERMFSDPVNATVAARLVAEAPPKYEWKTFHNSNVLLQNAFSPEKGWRLLDAYTPTVLRADSHIGGRDCLHYCILGPADHWIILLYNIILAATSGS